LAEALVLSRADLALVVPAGFGDRLRRGDQARLQVIIDGAESNSGTVGLGYLGKALGGYSMDSVSANLPAIAMRTEGRLRSLPMIVAQTRFRFNPDLKSSFFFVPGVIGMTTMIMTILMTNMALTREREVGTIEQLVVTPIKSYELMLGKILPFTLIGLVDITLILPVATGHFGLPLRGSIPLIYLGALLFFMSSLGIALIISTMARTQQQAVFVTFLFIFPLVLLSGLMFPIANMPEPIQWLTALNPLRYFLVVLRGVIIKGNGFMTLLPEFAKMLALGIGTFTVAVLRFKRNID
jgi:ABC-2 type transport system permease protein